MTNPQVESRRNVRYATTTEVWWAAPGDAWEVCETGDLSEVGCFILATKQPSAQFPLNVSIQVADDNWLRLKGKVVYGLEVGFGVEFIYDAESDKQTISDFIKAQRSAHADIPA